MKALPVSVVLLAALITAGCGGEPVDEPAAAAAAPQVTETSAPPSETATPTPTPVPITIEEAGSAYLALVAPSNALADQAQAAVDAEDWAQLRVVAAQLAAADRAFADGLLAAEWPPGAQSAVDSLVAELAGHIQGNLAVAASTTDEELSLAFEQFPTTGTSAQQLRMILGLDNVSVG